MRNDLINQKPKIEKNTSVIYNPISHEISNFLKVNNLNDIIKKITYFVLVVWKNKSLSSCN